MKRGRVKPRTATPRRRTSPREDFDWWAWANPILWARSNGMCEHCGTTPIVTNAERHHRQRRRDGGDRLSNVLLLAPAHHAWVTEHPAEARELGLIVSSYAEDPATVPVQIGSTTYLLDDEGGRERVL